MPDAADFIRRMPLLANLPKDVQARISRRMIRRSYSAGETIFIEGDPGRAAYLVAEGRVRVHRTSRAGREQVLARIGLGQLFNTVPLFRHDARNHATAQAATDVTVYAILREDLLRLVQDSPELALVILRDFAERLDHLTNLVEDLSLRTVRGRLARFLLVHAKEGTVRRQWTQEEMASELGTVRDVIGRALRSFASEGLIRMDRHRIVLVDREGLESESDS